jgi:uncharacterized membrane protein
MADSGGSAGARSGSALERMGHAASEALDAGIDKAKDTLARAGEAVGGRMNKARHALGGAADGGGHEVGNGMDKARAMAHDASTRMRDALRAGPGGEWTPTARNSALAGAALLARGAANQPLLPMLRGRGMGMDQTIDFSKSIHIDAAPDDVYDLWTHYENFPHFMSHVVEVRDLGRGRSHWVVRGPGGSEFEWNAVLTEQTRPHRLAWRSEAGAEIPQSGSIQFEPHRGGTRVTVHMSYSPPAGAIGHGLATLLGSDPKSQMDDDLARMKAFIERGAVPRDAARPRAGSRWLH